MYFINKFGRREREVTITQPITTNGAWKIKQEILNELINANVPL